MNLSLLAALLFLQSPPPQACQVGQVIVDDDGHCCWPGQSWKRRGCHGKPQCPPGTVASRHGCSTPAPMGYPAAPAAYPAVPGQPPSPTFAGVAPLPAAAPVPVRFTAAKPDDSFEVEVLTSGMPACKTPCELQLVPDRYKVRVAGSARFTDKLTVTGQPLDLQIERSKAGWKAFGIASVAVGGVTFVGGALYGFLVLISTSLGDREQPYPSDPYWARKRNQALLGCAGVSLAGAALAIGGGVGGFKNAGHTRISPARANAVPAAVPEATPGAPDPAAAPAPEPTSTEREEPTLQLLGIGAVPTETGVQLGAVFSF